MCRDSVCMCVSAFLSNQLFILISVFVLSSSLLFFFLTEPFIPSYFQCISYKNRDALLYNPKTTVTHKKADTDSMSSNIRPIFIFFQMCCNYLGFKILLAAACNLKLYIGLQVPSSLFDLERFPCPPILGCGGGELSWFDIFKLRVLWNVPYSGFV